MIELVAKTAQTVFNGSAKARQKMPAIQTRRFYDMFEKDFFKKGGITADQIEQGIKQLHPEAKVYVNKKYNSTPKASVMPVFNDDLTLNHYKLTLPLNRAGILKEKHIDSLMHEIRHVFDLVYNRKYLRKIDKLSLRTGIEQKLFYNANLYPRLPKNRKKLTAEKIIINPEEIEKNAKKC